MGTGVYCWKNTTNGKVYVGAAFRSFGSRRRDHLTKLNSGRSHNRHLQSAWKKYGASSFKFLILERCEPDRVAEREAYWISKLDATSPEHGYNVCPEGTSRLGVRHCAEARDKMSRTKKRLYATKPGPRTGAVLSDETRAKISEAKTGRPLSQKTKDKMSATRRGRKWSEAHREAMARHHWSRGPRAAEIAAKIAKANTGLTKSQEVRDKISATKRAKGLIGVVT